MCFSASASFAAAGVLSAIGVTSLKAAPSRSHAPFAAIPLLFAAQQASEGALWLVLDHAAYNKSDTPIARVFLFFALFVWPVYIAAALLPIERSPARRRVLRALAVGGAALGAYLMACASLRPSDSCIVFDNLYYWVQFDLSFKRLVPYVYAAFIVGPLVVSSVRGTSVLAAAALVSFAVTGSLYRVGFVSVWCFFAAALSGIVAIVVRLRRER